MEFLTLIKFDISYHIARKPVVLVYLFVFPFLVFFLLSHLTNSNFSGGVSSFDYYGLTSIIYFQLTMGTIVSNMIMEEKVRLPNMRIANSLVNESHIYISKIVSLVLSNAISLGGYVFLLIQIWNVDFGGNPWVVYITYLILGFFSICLGTFICILLRDESMCNNILGIVQLILCILGGIFFPIAYLGKIGAFLSNFSIVMWINNAISVYVYENSVGMLWGIWIASTLLSVILLFGARKMFRIQFFI